MRWALGHMRRRILGVMALGVGRGACYWRKRVNWRQGQRAIWVPWLVRRTVIIIPRALLLLLVLVGVVIVPVVRWRRRPGVLALILRVMLMRRRSMHVVGTVRRRGLVWKGERGVRAHRGRISRPEHVVHVSSAGVCDDAGIVRVLWAARLSQTRRDVFAWRDVERHELRDVVNGVEAIDRGLREIRSY